MAHSHTEVEKRSVIESIMSVNKTTDSENLPETEKHVVWFQQVSFKISINGNIFEDETADKWLIQKDVMSYGTSPIDSALWLHDHH